MTVETYQNPDFRHLVRVTRHGRRVEPADGSTPNEYLRSLILANARYGRLMELPFVVYEPEDASRDARRWMYKLFDQRFRVGKEGYPRFRELMSLVDLDHWDEELAARFDALGKLEAVSKPVDASELAELELEG